jgi:hypothetical protein
MIDECESRCVVAVVVADARRLRHTRPCPFLRPFLWPDRRHQLTQESKFEAMNLSAFADLLASRGLRLLPGSYAVPVDLLVELPEATIAHFTARGTTIRLRLYSPESLTAIAIVAECGCGDHHPQVGPERLVLGCHAVPMAEYSIDGELLFGWQNHEAGLLRLVDASAYFFVLLGQVPVLVSPAVAQERTLVGVA